MSFHIGQRVICVDASFPGCAMSPCDRALKVGGVYTVRAIVSYEGVTCIHLVEIKRSGKGLPYRGSRFRPIQERKTDISFAHEILKKVTRKQTERA